MHTSAKCLDTDPDPNRDPWSGSSPKFTRLFTGPMPANLPWKFHAKPSGSFCAKLLTNRQTDNDDYISSLAEVKDKYNKSETDRQARGRRWAPLCTVVLQVRNDFIFEDKSRFLTNFIFVSNLWNNYGYMRMARKYQNTGHIWHCSWRQDIECETMSIFLISFVPYDDS